MPAPEESGRCFDVINNKEFRSLILLGSACTLIFSACGFFFSGTAGGALLLLPGAALIGIFAYYTKQRYLALERLNGYLTGVLAGEESLEISDQEEGELSILKTNIYKAATMLRYQKELLAKDKIRLADALADISHQLKTPLTSMMVMNDLLLNDLLLNEDNMSGEDLNRRREFLMTQSAQLDRMNWLIQTLLKISRLDAGTIALKQEEVSAKELIGSAVKPFEIQMELKEIRTEISGGEMLLRCDKNWTTEALQNIIKNCYEHMDSGGVLRIETEDTNLFRQITISDSGCGIAEEDLPHIFERFYKGKNARRDSVGIGLAFSKAIVESQRGEILVDSEEGTGTRFRVRFYKTII